MVQVGNYIVIVTSNFDEFMFPVFGEKMGIAVCTSSFSKVKYIISIIYNKQGTY